MEASSDHVVQNSFILVLSFGTSLVRVFAHVLHSCRILYQFYIRFISFMRNNLSQNLETSPFFL